MGARAVFWGCASGAGWVLAGYPLALALLPRRPWEQDDRPRSVTVLVPAYRERALLPAKLRSIAGLDYPTDLVEVVVVSDGDPQLATIARAACRHATVLLQPQRRGKPAALNAGLAQATGEIVLLTDAHTPLAPDSLLSAVTHFADPAVLGVSGRWGESGSAYDAYEHVLRRLETRSGSTTGVFGGFFAVRRTALAPWPDDVVNDDLWLLCRLLRAGGRVVYEPAAQAVEPELATARQLERRTRIGAGRTLLLRELRGLPAGAAWRLASHKAGRLALPFLLLGAWLSAARLRDRPGYRAAAAAQLAVYGTGGLAAVGIVPPPPARLPARAAGQFLVGNLATARGVARAVLGRQSVRWKAVR